MGKMLSLTDVNGKQFEVDINSITDMTTDLDSSSDGMTLSDADRTKLANFKVDMIDAEGNEFDAIKLLDEVKADPTKMPSALDVTFEATHSGKNRNHTIYHSDSMQNDMQSWKSPFAKPMLKNHNMYSEPLGRVQDFSFGQSELNPERDAIDVTYRVTDKDAIEKILDGRYKTMSIGASVGHLQCNICGKDIVKDGVFKFCGHWKGDNYGGQKALWNAKDLQYKEGSIVNNPADDWAQIKKVAIVGGTVNSKTKVTAGTTTNSKDGKNMENDLLNSIDALANEGATSTTTDTATTTTTDANTTTTTTVDSDTTTTATDATTQATDANADLETVKAQRDNLITEKKVVEDKVVELTGQVKTLNDEIDSLKQTALVADEESKVTRKQTIQLAVLNKKLMAQRVIDHEIFNKTLTDDKKESRLAELLAKPAKEISDAVDSLVSAVATKVRDAVTPVTNPGAVNDSDKNAIPATSTETVTTDSNKKAQISIKDFEDSVINVFTRK